MVQSPRPFLAARNDQTYYCAEIRVLYQWLEAHSYNYYGTFGPTGYGRFACEELALADAAPVHCSSYIEVHINGEVVAIDDRAKQILDAIITGASA